MPRAESAIRFVKERLRSIQCETPFSRYPKRLTIEMTRRVTILINSFRRKSGVHPVMSPRQLLFGKTFKTPLCKMGELVLAYNVTSNNKTSKPRAFYALYIGPNDAGTGHSVFKLGTKSMIVTPRCKPIPMPDDVIQLINQMGIDDGSPEEGIVFRNIHHALTVENLYHDVDPDDNSDNASDTSLNNKEN